MKSLDRVGKGVALGAAAASLLSPQLARAGGIYAGDSGSQAQSRAGAFVAKADDPTAIMHNPAGLMKATHFEIFAGANLVSFSQSFDRSGVYQPWTDAKDPTTTPPFQGTEMPEISDQGPPQPVPFLAATQRFGPIAFGEGVFAPQGYPNRDNPRTVDLGNGVIAPGPERYDMIKQESIAVLPSLAVAYRVGNFLDLGARASWGFGNLKATTSLWALPNEEEDVEKDALFSLDVKTNFAPSFGAGFLLRPIDSIEIGGAYSSETRLEMKGTGKNVFGARSNPTGGDLPTLAPLEDKYARCATGGTAEAPRTCVTIVIPQTATLGARYVLRDRQGNERGDLELDVRWENWKAATDIRVIVDAEVETPILKSINDTVLHHGFQDVISTRLGGSYSWPSSLGTITARGGASYDTPTAPEKWSRLDIDGSARLQVAAGAALDRGSYRIDLGFGAIFSPNRTVTGPDQFDKNPPDDTKGEYVDAQSPTDGEKNQKLHPVNEGAFKSGYLILATGVTFMF
jgi:long-subunit fatty acid transport protein